MSRKKQGQQTKDKYTRDLEQFIPDYVAATGDHAWTTDRVAEWAIENDKWEQRKISAIRQLARELSRVARQVHITNDKGERVRKYHPYRLGHDQPMLWASIDEIAPEQMNESKTMRRNMLAAGCVQLNRDLCHFNDHYNPGDPLLFDPDFTNDIADTQQPDEYRDSPSPDDQSDD